MAIVSGTLTGRRSSAGRRPTSFKRQLIRERTIAGLEAARARGRVGGRPCVMGPDRVEAARALLAQSGATITGVAAQLDVSRNTIYRNVLAGEVRES